MRGLIARLADGGRTVFVSSHVLAELEQVCDWFVVIDHGALVFQGPTAKLMDGAATRLIAEPEHATGRDTLVRMLQAKGYQVEQAGAGLAVTVACRDPRALAADVSRTACAGELTLVELRLERASLEDRYLSLVNGGDR